MTDEAPETPDTPTPIPTPDTPEIPWQKRYEDLRPEFDRTSQELSSLRADPNALVTFLREHHPDLLEDEEPEPTEPEFQPDEDRPLTRAEFEEWKNEQTQAQQAKSSQDQFEADYKAVLNGRDIPKHGDRAIRYALNQGEIRNSDDLKQAVDEYFEELEAAAPKSRPRVPHAIAGGQAATHVPDWDKMTAGEQNRYMHTHEAQT
jgi:hypothetical protein